MDKIITFVKQNKHMIIRFAVLTAIALTVELTAFNFSSWKTMGLTPVTIANEAVTDDEGHFHSEWIELNETVKNVYVEDVVLFNCDRAYVQVTVTDEGDEYEYEMPVYEVTPGIASSGYSNIYTYGNVTGLSIHMYVPEGGAAVASNIYINYNRPFDIKPLRLMALWVIMLLLSVCADNRLYLKKNSVCQKAVIVALAVGLIIFGKWLSRTNNNIVSCPWPHHKQYQELAVALDGGTVKLLDKEVDPALLEKDNPYDTIALTAEGIFYNMDYAYFDGSYYVYFGIIPELLLYYPHYKLTGTPLNNYDAQSVFFAILVVGVLLTIWKLSFRYGSVDGECRVTLLTYVLMSVAAVLFSNNIYLISRADIYNIPVMAATAFTWIGFGLWLAGLDEDNRVIRIVCYALGSFAMAATVGCRPQFALYSLTAILLFLITADEEGKMSFKARKLFSRLTIGETVAFCLPYVVIAAVVCWYNYARFGSILDFGATYSLTTNDMNHRGFNMNRLLRGLYAFFFQPAVINMDFPYLCSSKVSSDYMGRNLTEFVYGGCFVTNLILLPAIAAFRIKVTKGVRALIAALVTSSVIIAAFDVNGAGILYRYTCDFVPGMLIAAIIVWICLLGKTNAAAYTQIYKLFAICVIVGLSYSLLVFLASGDSVNLHDNSPILYEQIRAYFRV